MTRERRYTLELQKHDQKLYCRKAPSGTYEVFEKAYSVETYDVEGDVCHFLVRSDNFVVALTDNWSIYGRPVEWGLDPLMAKIRLMDKFNKDAEMHRLDEMAEKKAKQKERDLANKCEDIAREIRPVIAKDFNDFNTSTFKKTDKRRIKDAYHQ